MTRWILSFGFGILGAALGLFYGWRINPVKLVDTTPALLRADYRTDYVLMVAESYHLRQDGDAAQRQLALFGGDGPAAICLQAVQTAHTLSYSQNDLALLQELTRAMQSRAPGPPAPIATP